MTIEVDIESIGKIREVGGILLGTCQDPDVIVQQVFGDENLALMDLPIDLLHELDSITMVCDTCGWWCEAHEFDEEDGNCADCRGDKGDEDDDEE
jgi:hypothetical protein